MHAFTVLLVFIYTSLRPRRHYARMSRLCQGNKWSNEHRDRAEGRRYPRLYCMLDRRFGDLGMVHIGAVYFGNLLGLSKDSAADTFQYGKHSL